MNRLGRVTLGMTVLLVVLGPASAVSQNPPIRGTSISVDLSGVLTVVDNHACTVRQYTPGGTLLREIGGQGWGNDQFDRPSGVWAKNGIDVFVADYGNHRIQRFDNGLAYVSTLYTRDNSDPDKRFGYPTAVSLSRLGELFICDGENNRIAKVGASNQIDLTFGGYGAGSGRLIQPIQIDCGPNDDVYVLDPPRIIVFDTFGNYIAELGPGLFTHPAGLSATQTMIVVLDTMAVFAFDAQQHLIGRIDLPDSTRSQEPSGCALTSSAAYLIGPGGLTIIPLSAILDKDPNSR